MSEKKPSIDDFLESIERTGSIQLKLAAVVHENEGLMGELKGFDPIKLAGTFAGLLTMPELQSNCIRIETLIHLALSFGSGRRKPAARTVAKLFELLGKGLCGSVEDPAEDVFVTSISTSRGNYLVLEGIWESVGFHLQRAISALERISGNAANDPLVEQIFALLVISNTVCLRAGLNRYQLGNSAPQVLLPRSLAGASRSIRRIVKFSQQDLLNLGITHDHIYPFIFSPLDRSKLLQETIGHTTLEKHPLAQQNDEIHLMLPTAISAAIRRHIFEAVSLVGMKNAFVAALCAEYSSLFCKTPLVGGRIGAPIGFFQRSDCLLAEVLVRADVGRYLHCIFFIDTLEEFGQLGLLSVNTNQEALANEIDLSINRVMANASRQSDFVDGLTLIVGCGIGRTLTTYYTNPKEDWWKVDFISAADLFTLSWTPDITPLTLWRLLRAKEKIESLGVSLFNINGLLNLVAWNRSLMGHLVPHGDLPDAFASDSRTSLLMVNQNSLRSLRYEVSTHWDVHVEQDHFGRWLNVRKEGISPFAEDKDKSFYVAAELPNPMGMYVGENRTWWCEIECNADTVRKAVYERWRMVTVWLQQAVPVLEKEIKQFPQRPILWRIKFLGDPSLISNDSGKKIHGDVRNCIAVSVDTEAAVVSVIVGKEFDHATLNVENIAERALVEALVDGTLMLIKGSDLQIKKMAIMKAIVRNKFARYAHAFYARKFRDYVRSSLPKSSTRIDPQDDAAVKLGLGWRARQRSEGNLIIGKTKCTAFLNQIVRYLEDDLCRYVAEFDRLSAVTAFLKNHEAAAVERERWISTSAANLSLHDDQNAALATISSVDRELNAVHFSTRLLTEIAICECPLQGGRLVGKLDLSVLMAKAALLYGMGGWSDAIRWDAMEPNLRVTPLGDIHATQEFTDDIIAPFARVASDKQAHLSAEKYSERLQEPTFNSSIEDKFESTFLNAWKDEMGASIDEMRVFVDIVEDLGIRQNTSIIAIRKSELFATSIDHARILPEASLAIIDSLTLPYRSGWRNISAPFDIKDIQPWRFRRRLSILRRPLVQTDENEDPLIVMAPGILRDGLSYLIAGFHRGDFPGWQLKKKMNAWAGKAGDKRGREFTLDVAKRLRELGWQTRTEVKLPGLTQTPLDRDYGDIDVLSWDAASGRVLIIECKDVQYRKTFGEIAEQLADFRGQTRPDGKPDYLLRHLERVGLVRQHPTALGASIEVAVIGKIESHLVFRNPVPMEFALKKMEEHVYVRHFDLLSELQL